MRKKTKGRADCNQATLDTEKCTVNSTGFVSRIKGLIITLALWGWLPVPLVYWLINRGDADDE
ncbi:MAG: hypothetical protein KUG53_01380 [Pseudomonadales bacterium]|nr:hypothetical protein [Pseudomonadales bacterium]